MPLPAAEFKYKAAATEIPYDDLDLEQPWTSLNLDHQLTRKGIQKFVADYRSTSRHAS